MDGFSAPLLAALEDYAASGMVPMHMPGHKRNEALLGDALPWRLDVTEVEGFDNLHGAEGLLKAAMERAARLYGGKRSFFLVNGSTCGLLAAIRALTGRGDRILVARGCHRSVYHAMELNGLRPVYLMPPVDGASGVAGGIEPASVAAALAAHPDIRLCALTSPTYEGVVSDIRAIADILHARGVALLVDEAHGAHFLSPRFPESAARLGADCVVHSLHKTLPSLTQTALLHVLTDRVDAQEIARQLSIFETSSPSYPLMASIDRCVGLMAERGEELLAAFRARTDRFRARVRPMERLRVLEKADVFYALDPGKITLVTRGSSTSGYQLMDELRARGFELEMATPGYALALATLADGEDALDRLAGALLEIDRGLLAAPAEPIALPGPPRVELTIDAALALPGETVAVERAVGRIAQEYAWVYPPGAPLIAPGERVGEELPGWIARLRARTSSGQPGTLRVVTC